MAPHPLLATTQLREDGLVARWFSDMLRSWFIDGFRGTISSQRSDTGSRIQTGSDWILSSIYDNRQALHFDSR